MFLSRFFLSICCCLSGTLFAQNVVVGAGVDPDGGGGVVLEYHTGGSFSEVVSNWPWATAIRFDTDSDLWAGAGVHQQFAFQGCEPVQRTMLAVRVAHRIPS